MRVRVRIRVRVGVRVRVRVRMSLTCGEVEGAARRAVRSEAGGSGWALGSSSHLDRALSSLTCS